MSVFYSFPNEALGIVKQDRSNIEVSVFLMSNVTMQIKLKESEKEISDRIDKIQKSPHLLSSEDISLKEVFGRYFLTSKYHLKKIKRI